MKLKDTLHYTRLLLAVIMFPILLWGVSACHSDDEWDNVPSEIAAFLNQYFPYSQINSFSANDTGYHVRISDGPGLTFDTDYKWEAIDGYGMPLPQVLLFDQLPPAMYDYLQETENLNSVFSIERNDTFYLATLLDTTVKYTLKTGELTGS